MTADGTRQVLQLIVCAAPPSQGIIDLIDLLHAAGWDVHIIATPTAMTWLALAEVEQRIDRPVLHRQRLPNEPSLLPHPQAIVVAPATFNLINAWAVGLNDSLALGVLNEALGGDVPIVVSVYAKSSLTSHPAFTEHLRILRTAGVLFTDIEALRPIRPGAPFRWEPVMDLLRTAL